jgi:hypothetical protein
LRRRQQAAEPIRDIVTTLHAGIGTGEDKSKPHLQQASAPPLARVQVQRGHDAPTTSSVPVFDEESERRERERGFTYQGGPNIDLTKPETSRFPDIDLRSAEDRAPPPVAAPAPAPRAPAQFHVPRGEPFVDQETGRPGSRATSRQQTQATGQGRTEPRDDYQAYSNPDQIYAVGGLVRVFADGGPSTVTAPTEAAGFVLPSFLKHEAAPGSSSTSVTLGAGSYAEGGLVPARVSHGEYRMSAAAVGRYGSAFMDRLNAGGLVKGFLGGGLVVGGQSSSASEPNSGGVGAIVAQQAGVGFGEAAQAYAAAAPGAQNLGAEYSQGDQGLTGLGYSPQSTALLAGSGLMQFGAGAGTSPATLPPNAGMLGYGGGMGAASLGLPPAVASSPQASSFEASHVLNLATSGGTFQVNATPDTMEAIRVSAIGGQLTSTGSKPSWY